MRKLLVFIVNPFSGTTSKANFESLVDKNIDKSKFEVKISYTHYPLHARELVTQEVKTLNPYAVIAVGGDGTVNEVASAVVNTDICLGVIPAGSGNGFGSHIGMTRNMAKSLISINKANPVIIDTGLCNGDKAFVNIAGIGFDGHIVHQTKKDSKRGFFNYFKSTINLLPQYQPINASILLDGSEKVQGSYASIVVANATTYGYNFKIAPDAKFSDGLFDIVLIKDAPLYKYFLYSPLYFTKGAKGLKFLEHYRCKKIEVETDIPSFYHLDGEGIKGGAKYYFDLIPDSLKVLIP
jgi:YegS/Rv2252/BmrU family lipid kinase